MRGEVAAVVVALAVVAGAIGTLEVAEDEGVAPASNRSGTPAPSAFSCEAPTAVAAVAGGEVAPGTDVCVEGARVVANETFRRHHGDGRNLGVFTVQADNATLTGRVSGDWWDHGTPAEGMVVTFEGTVAERDGEPVVDPVTRWFERDHQGQVATVAEVAAGEVPEHTYVWVPRAGVGTVFQAGDGDHHVEVGTTCPLAHLVTEVTPPYRPFVPPPDNGSLVRLYGQVRYDPGHGWWEVHPIRDWERIPATTYGERCPEDDQPLPPPGFVPDELPPASPAPGGR